ncbi:MAG: hypothetical protein FWD90_05040 [Defluviitaleaceae bacterium]|nr:hypothetical protein [Defluviitaleaceae bacterium]
MIIRFVIYGALGCLMEVLWTGLGTFLKKDYTLRSTTSLWMFFIYGMVVLLEPVFRLVSAWPFFLRGILYAVCILGGEFLTGSLLKKAALCPWDYTGSRYHVMGIIRWDYAPAWAAAGLFFEQIYLYITR